MGWRKGESGHSAVVTEKETADKAGMEDGGENNQDAGRTAIDLKLSVKINVRICFCLT